MPKHILLEGEDQNGRLVVPDSVTTIESAAFLGKGSLTSVIISDSVTTIEDNAFVGCKNLRSVVISDSVTTVGKGVFTQCGSLSSATISKALNEKINSAEVFGPDCKVTVVESVTLPFDLEYKEVLPDGKLSGPLTISSDNPEFVIWNEQSSNLSTGGRPVPYDQVDKRLLIYCACQAPLKAKADSSAGYGAKSLCDSGGRKWEKEVVFKMGEHAEEELWYEISFVVGGIMQQPPQDPAEPNTAVEAAQSDDFVLVSGGIEAVSRMSRKGHGRDVMKRRSRAYTHGGGSASSPHSDSTDRPASAIGIFGSTTSRGRSRPLIERRDRPSSTIGIMSEPEQVESQTTGIVQDSGLMQNWLTKKGGLLGRSQQKRWFVWDPGYQAHRPKLTRMGNASGGYVNAIQYFNVVSIKSRKLCGDIEIDSETRISSSGKKLEIVNPNRTWELTAATPEVASKWAACLKSFLTRKLENAYADITEAETVATLDLEESADILPTTSPLSIIGEVFSHRDPFLEVWTPYTQEQSKAIAEARKLSPEKGSIKLLGTPASLNFEIRWGAEARSGKMPNPPYTKIVQVNTANSNTRVVRCEIEAETASQPALPAQNTVAESDAVVVWEFQGKMQGKTVQWEQYNDSDTNLLEDAFSDPSKSKKVELMDANLKPLVVDVDTLTQETRSTAIHFVRNVRRRVVDLSNISSMTDGTSPTTSVAADMEMAAHHSDAPVLATIESPQQSAAPFDAPVVLATAQATLLQVQEHLNAANKEADRATDPVPNARDDLGQPVYEVQDVNGKWHPVKNEMAMTIRHMQERGIKKGVVVCYGLKYTVDLMKMSRRNMETGFDDALRLKPGAHSGMTAEATLLQVQEHLNAANTEADRATATSFTVIGLIREQSDLFARRKKMNVAINNSVHQFFKVGSAEAISTQPSSDPLQVNILREIEADTAKQQPAAERLDHLGKERDPPATTVTSASAGCAIVAVNTIAIKQQFERIKEAFETFDCKQKSLRAASLSASTCNSNTGPLPMSRSNSADGGDGGDGHGVGHLFKPQKLTDAQEADILSRNEARLDCSLHVREFHRRWHGYLIKRLDYLRGKLKILRTGNSTFNAGMTKAAPEPPISSSVGDALLQETVSDAVMAYDDWFAHAKNEYDSVSNLTDASFVKLKDYISETLLRGTDDVDDSETRLNTTQAKLETVATNVRMEVAYWDQDPLSKLPYDIIKAACDQAIEAFEDEVKQTDALLQEYEALYARSQKLKTQPSVPQDLETFFDLEDKVDDFKYDLEAKLLECNRLRDAKRRLFNQAKLDAAKEDVNVVRANLKNTAAEFQAEKKRLKDLNRNHFPELSLQFPEADLLGVRDLKGLVLAGVTFETFGDGPKEALSKGQHNVFKTTLEGVPVVLKKFELKSESDHRKFQNEVVKLRGLVHPNIIKVESVVLETEAAYVQLAYHPGGDLKDWLGAQTPTPEQKQAILHQVCRGIEYLHGNNILHCDVKLENILMTDASSSARPILADFDISKDVEERALQTQTLSATTTSAVSGTYIYMAPEIRPMMAGGKGERQTERSDMYAFGIVTLLTFSSTCRKNVDEGQDPLDKAKAKALDEILDEDAPQVALKPLLEQLLAQDPAKRLTATDAANHGTLRVELVLSELEAQRVKVEAEKEREVKEREAEQERIRKEALEKQEAADKEARALQRECCICFDSFAVQDGIECSAPDADQRHFVCDDCLGGHVSEESNTDDLGSLASRDGNVFCPYTQVGCADSAAYTDLEVARHVDAETFACYLRGKQKLVEIKLVDEITATEKVKHEAELAQLATMSGVQVEARTHVQALNGVVNLKCPRDENHVFGPLPDDWDFKTECLTLKCMYPGCKCKFCGWCGKGFSSNALAHTHVGVCSKKPGGGLSFYSTREAWDGHRRVQLAEKIRSIVNGIGDAAVRKEVVSQQARLLAEYGIDANEFA